jgi:hypothetical protein
MKKNILIAATVAVGLFLYSCKKDNTTPITIKGSLFEVNASSWTRWVYFSFEKGDTVQIADPSTSTDWDVAFQRSNIKTNSGKSGKGIGGVSYTGLIHSTGFDSLFVVSDTLKYTVDDTTYVPTAYGTMEKVIANNLVSYWYDYNYANNVLTSKEQVYAVKTASGKYAKFIILNYYKEVGGTSGYVKFSYVYQSDGSKNLKLK